ncbi:MAG: hypothetical protein H0T91_00155, partial [Propionibacteriaceae bacterium]|nr:hypothetical protein [Propionibacteriaceae bacterium]
MARTSRAGQLQRIRRGAYVAPSTQPPEARDVHRRLIEATVKQGSTEAVVSHMSAAVLHGLPIWTDSLSRVHVTRDRGHGGKVRRYVHLHATPLAEDELTEIDGLRVTTMARTVVDLGRSLTQLRSVPIGDAALAQGLSIDELERAVARAAGRSGIGAARRMAAFCDGRSESVGESTSRVVFSQVGIPAPSLQYEVLSA